MPPRKPPRDNSVPGELGEAFRACARRVTSRTAPRPLGMGPRAGLTRDYSVG
jgi:hypothetical protein